MAVRLEALLFEDHVHAGEARARRCVSLPPRRMRPVEDDVGVMKHARIARPDSRSPAPIACCVMGTGMMKFQKVSSASAGKVYGRAARSTRSGCPNGQPLVELWRGRALALRSGRRALLHPVCEELDLRVGEAPLFFELSVARAPAATAAYSANR